MMKTTIKILENGMTLILQKAPICDVVAIQCWIGAGSACETPEERGVAHVLEHMIFKGTSSREVGDIVRDIENAGGVINAWTSVDETVFHVTLPATELNTAIDVLQDAILHPALHPDQLKREIPVVLEEIRMERDDPEQIAYDELLKRVFEDHGYGRPVLGTASHVRRLTGTGVRSFFERAYQPANMFIVIAGDIDSDHVQRRLNPFAAIPATNAAPLPSVPSWRSRQRAPRISVLQTTTSECNIAIGFPIPAFADDDSPAIDVLATVLGQGASSRLERVVCRELGLASDITAMAYTPKHAGVFTIFIKTSQSRLDACLREVFAQLARMCREKITVQELKKARTMIVSDEAFAGETVDGQARRLGYNWLMTRDHTYDRKYNGAVSGVTAAAVQRSAERYLRPNRVSVCCVIPKDADHDRTTKTTAPRPTRNHRHRITQQVRSALSSGFATETPRGRVLSSKVWSHILSNGDRLLVKSVDGASTVAARAVCLCGQRNESPHERGGAALLASLLVRGTGDLTGEAVARRMDELACAIQGFSGRNTTGISGEFLLENSVDGLSLMGDCLLRPALQKEEIRREKDIFLDAIDEEAHSGRFLAFSLFAQNLFGAHPYGTPLYGSAGCIRALTRDRLLTFFRKTIHRSPMVLAVVGDVSPDEITTLAERHFVTKKIKRPVLQPRPWRPTGVPMLVTHHLNREQSHVVVGFPGVTMTDSARYGVEVVMELLGGHGGRLFASIREEASLAYEVSSGFLEGIEPGYVAFYAATAPGSELAVISLIQDNLNRLMREGPSNDELQRVVRALIGGRQIATQRLAAQSDDLSLGALYGFGTTFTRQYIKGIGKVTTTRVRTIAKKLFQSGTMVISCVGPGVEAQQTAMETAIMTHAHRE